MKKKVFAAVLCLTVALLGACTRNDAQQSGAAPETSTALPANSEKQSDISSSTPGGSVGNDVALPVDAPSAEENGETDTGVDLDLSRLSGTVVYSQIYDMVINPSAYMGKRIRVRGSFNYFKDPSTQREYFAAVIADATACCAQGIEFIWGGEHVYPSDYPPPSTEITVTGTLDTYIENGFTYLQLLDADVQWKG